MSRKEPIDLPVRFVDEKVSVRKIVPNAEYPIREHGSTDVTHDIILIGRTDNRSEDDTQEINAFRTGLIVTPPDGFYVQIVPHPDLHKHGYFLARNPMIIQPRCQNELVIPLYKFKEAEDLALPFTAVQMIVYRAVYAHVSDVSLAQKKNNDHMEYGGGYNMQSPSYGLPTNMQNSQNSGYRDNSGFQMRNYGNPGTSRGGTSGRSSNMF